MVQRRPLEAQPAISPSSSIFPSASSTLPSGSNFYPPRVSNAIAPFATGPLPYPPPPHPGAPNVEVCRRCGMLLPFRAADGSTDFIRNAHFSGQCGSAPGFPARYVRNPLGDALGAPTPSSSSSSAAAQAQLRNQAALLMHAQHRARREGPSTSTSSLPEFPYSRNPPQYQPQPFLLRRPGPPVPPSSPLLSRYPPRAPSPDTAQRAFAPVPTMATYPATEKDCVNAEGETMECVICLEEFEVGDELAMLECFCKFHKRCIVEWYEKGSGMCPTHKIINPGGSGDGNGLDG